MRRPSWAGGSPRCCEEGQGAPGLPPGSSPRGPRGRTAQEPASRLPLLAGWWGLPAKSRSLSRPNRVCSMYRLQGVSKPSAPLLLAGEDRDENPGIL